MTQEEKARRYDEAIKRAREKYDMFEGMKQGDVLEDVFPELKESGDERNWKLLLQMIHYNVPDSIFKHYKLNKDKFECWLEKQGEQKNFASIEPKFKDGDVLHSPSHHLIWIHKDNEHYYACVNMNYTTKNIATNGLITIPNDACPTTKDEQTILFARMKEAGYEWDAEKKELKKIEQKYVWSEEDENILRTIISDGIRGAELDMQQIDWLKSLKERYTWKPSDRQMASITCAVKKMKESACYDSELVSLLNDLKKLKRE